MNLTNPTGHWQVTKLGTTVYSNRWIVLDWDGTDGKFYDTDGAGTPFLTITGCKFADIINTNGKIYISPLEDITVPLDDASNGFIWLYDGTTARLAGGVAPDLTAGPTTVAEDLIAVGNSTPGQHLFAIIFETDSGFLSPLPLPATWISLTAAGGWYYNLLDIPLGPAGTVARIVTMTRAITAYDGIPENWEMFQAYRLADNTSTLCTFDMPDSGLIDSVDYLLDIYDNIPACNRISTYGSRLMFNGPHTDPSIVIVSKPNDPETASQGEDYIQKPDGSPGDIYVGRELRDVYYIFKESSTWATRETGDAPNSWPIDLIDSGIGCAPFGIGEVLANTGSLLLDNFIVVGLSGVYIFSGTYSKEPISRNIQSAFTDQTYIGRFQVNDFRLVIDPVRRLFFILLATIDDNPAANEYILYVGNYFNGLTPDTVKWATWEETGGINSIQVYSSVGQSYFPCLTITYPDGTGVYYELLQGAVTAIPAPSWSYVTGYNSNPDGALYTFASVRVRALGIPYGEEPPLTQAVLNIGYGDLDSSSIVTTEQLTIVAKPGKYYTSLLNRVGEKLRISLSGSFYFMISKVVLFVSERAKDRQR